MKFYIFKKEPEMEFCSRQVPIKEEWHTSFSYSANGIGATFCTKLKKPFNGIPAGAIALVGPEYVALEDYWDTELRGAEKVAKYIFAPDSSAVLDAVAALFAATVKETENGIL